ncbi:hypothetical protein ACFL0K_00550 [Patescibacteria group bacterium]
MKNKKTNSGILIMLIFIAGYFLFFNKNVWQGFYYPDGCLSCEEDYIFSPKFKGYDDGLADCVTWGNNIRKQGNSLEKGDIFECGLNCKNEIGLFVCEETVDF